MDDPDRHKKDGPPSDVRERTNRPSGRQSNLEAQEAAKNIAILKDLTAEGDGSYGRAGWFISAASTTRHRNTGTHCPTIDAK